MKGKYLYGVIKRDTSRYPLNLDSLTTVTYQNLAAVVEEKEVKDYLHLPKEETIKELISHQRIIEKIMEHSPILPVKFGTVLKDDQEVTSVLEKGLFLKNILREMEGKIELDLVCFWNEAKAAQMAYKKSSRVRSLAASEDKIALGKSVTDYLASKREKLSNRILKILKKEAIASCGHALADVNMLLNQAFLVEKEQEEAFNHALNQLDSKFADLLNFRLVGPLPPYSFATLVVDSLDEKEVAKARESFQLNGQLSMKKLKQTYDEFAMRLHPDKGGSPLEFKLATAAYKLLKNFIQNGLITVSLYKWEER